MNKTKKSPEEWYKWNWDFYLRNKEHYANNKKMEEMKNIILESGQDFNFFDMSDEGGYAVRENEFSSTDEENLKDIEYKAYYHYFVAKQNRKRAMEFHEKIRDNALQKAERIGDRDTEGDYLDECNWMKDDYEVRTHHNNLMDASGWWDYRQLGKKLYKIYS